MVGMSVVVGIVRGVVKREMVGVGVVRMGVGVITIGIMDGP
jgi:hypothetical protein